MNVVWNCCNSAFVSICDATLRAFSAINETIKKIGQYHLGLIAASLCCAYLHDYNIVLVYVAIGVFFPNHVNEVAESVAAVFHSVFLILQPIADYEMFNRKVFYYPIHSMIYSTSVLAFILLKPISLLFFEAYCAMRCGANIVDVSRKLVDEAKVQRN